MSANSFTMSNISETLTQDKCFTSFCSDIDAAMVPTKLNNPFVLDIPDICKIAAEEVQVFLKENQQDWQHNFGTDGEFVSKASSTTKRSDAKGKMFGVLVVRNADNELGYLFTFSGKLADEQHHHKFVPSIFDIATDDYFMNRGMTELTVINNRIKELKEENELVSSEAAAEIKRLKEVRKAKSIGLQQQLFDCYSFLNLDSVSKSLCDIFQESRDNRPPAGAGECAAPKLLQYAIENRMQPLALAEFWWGKASKSGDRQHRLFYPACDEKCLPILEHVFDRRLK